MVSDKTRAVVPAEAYQSHLLTFGEFVPVSMFWNKVTDQAES